MANDAIIAPNNNELQLLPAVEEIGNLNQRLYRLLTNILEQPDDVKHVHSLVELLSQKIAKLKINTKNYKVDTTVLEDRYDRPTTIPIQADDGRERIYWGPQEAKQLKDEIVAEVVEVIKKSQNVSHPPAPIKKSSGASTALVEKTLARAKNKKPPTRRPSKKVAATKKKKQFNFNDTPK